MHAGGCNPTFPRRAMLGLLRGSEVSLLRDALALSTPSDAARVRAFWDTAGNKYDTVIILVSPYTDHFL